MVLKAYFDESGTHGDQGITALAGYVGTADAWNALEAAWQEELRPYAHLGVKTFHMSECMGAEGSGEFARVEKFHRDVIVVNLSKILAKSELQPIWSAVLTEAWTEFVTDPEFLARYPKPLDLCFEHIVRQLAGWARRAADGEVVVPVFAYSKEYSPRMDELGRVWGQTDWYRSVLGSISFGFPSQVVPLQAADFLVHEIGWHWDNQFYGPLPTLIESGYRQILDNATQHRGLHMGGCYDAVPLRNAVKHFKETGEII